MTKIYILATIVFFGIDAAYQPIKFYDSASFNTLTVSTQQLIKGWQSYETPPNNFTEEERITELCYLLGGKRADMKSVCEFLKKNPGTPDSPEFTQLLTRWTRRDSRWRECVASTLLGLIIAHQAPI